MTETTPGREVIQIVEIKQPFCSRTHGSAPCTATGAGCYNTRATCQDAANFALGTPLSLFFSKGMVAEQQVEGADYIIPSLVSVSTVPTRINYAGLNPDASGLGNRASVSIRFRDHPHTDRLVDPYLSTRAYDPYERSSFWAKWAVRNKYRNNIEIVVYEGYAGQSLAQMTSRTYFLEAFTGPDSNGGVTITAKDILARAEERKAQAPRQSPGVLYAGINDSVTSFEVANAVEADYPATGTLRINDEVLTYTGRATSANGITFTGVARGTDNTTAVAHDAEDAVQECLRYTAASVDTILADLLENYAGIDPTWLDTANWATEVANELSFYNLTRLITKPEPVNELIGELQQQALCFVWWDERSRLVKLSAVKAIASNPPVLTEESHIIAGSLSLAEKPRERVSQVWIYYLPRNPVSDGERAQDFKAAFVLADLESEGDTQFGEQSLKKIYSRWLPSDALVNNTATKLLRGYVDPPLEIKLRVDAKDRALGVGDVIGVNHYLLVDEVGENQTRYFTVIESRETQPGEVVELVARDITTFGFTSTIQPAGAADYDTNTVYLNGEAFIGNALGLLSDGSDCARIV